MTFQKKILVFAHDSYLYGASQSLLTVLKNISGKNKILVVLPYGGAIEAYLGLLNIQYKIVAFPRCVVNRKGKSVFDILKAILWYYKRMFVIMPKLRMIAENFKPDIIYTNTSVVTAGYLLSKTINVPHIWHIREFGDDYRYLPSKRKVAECIKSSDEIICASDILGKYWANSRKYHVIYNGIEKAPVRDIYSEEYPAGDINFGMPGVISQVKNHDIAIKAFAVISTDFPQCYLHFYGDLPNNDYYNSLVKLISRLNCTGRVFFHPFNENADTVYNEISILINCTEREGFGRTVIEAMSRGIPVISNASGGPLEIIDDGITGLLYNKTPESLSEKMVTLLSDTVLYRKISENAKIKALKEYSVDRYVHEVELVLKNTAKIND